ncbi:FAD/NAD(P)-binding domain-containing protein [Meira miltonrushii]|uniref:FAD/NAD(P)-binding domain-containing protein n=1 Tax=Meira miltonrushii TaxID=1280837 RepID=A0A316VEG7_9BASI|nr:FAD/NAD(P)-binding domain-containing protein [Meira miltonrushii]PWN35910.1 FAD/NAD(P)-binding domain-containing protein [Meira miltonrushii]
MRICIVGAGSAGMTMAKQILDARKQFKQGIEFILFERRDEVGGIWQHEKDIKDPILCWEQDDTSLLPCSKSARQKRRLRLKWQEAWPPGAMFEGLRTNIPCDLMSYRDSLFRDGTDLYPSRETVQEYLEKYADQHELRRNVKFSTTIERIIKDERSNGWSVTYNSNGGNQQSTTEQFTHLVLAHGRCSVPNIPNIEGITTFSGRILHSAWYRDPTLLLKEGEPKRILIVGNASSGMDIARELSGFITRNLPCGFNPKQWLDQCQKDPFEVLSSWHSPEKPPPMDYNPLDPESPAWCKRIKVVESIESIQGDRIHLADGSILSDIPLIIFATGFLFDNAFLDQTAGMLNKYPLLPPSSHPSRIGFPSASVYNLDDWFLCHSKDETLAMLGLPITVVPFPFTEIQAMYLIHRWLDKAPKLPFLDRSIPPTDEQRWRSERKDANVNGHSDDQEVILNTTPHTFGKPSDQVYLDRLISMLQLVDKEAGKEVPWKSDYSSDGKGHGFPKGPEARFATSPWRTERRNAGRLLRRETLGY